MTPDSAQQALKQLSLGLGVFGVCCGILLSYGVLAGDDAGRVNLLLLLLLFAFLPVAALLLSLFLVLKGGGKGLSGWILDLPLWPTHLTRALPALAQAHAHTPWLFYQTQILSLGFGTGCVLSYLLLLLGSDITFVWRSTLLEPADLLPALQAISLPWQFWPEAQPSLALIEQTRDFRLATPGALTTEPGLWWQYILAAQLTYNVLPRTLMLLLARRQYLQRVRAARVSAADAQATPGNTHKETFTLAPVIQTIPVPYTLLDWAGAPENCLQQLQARLGAAAKVLRIGPLPEGQDPLPADQATLVVLVKSWEPPLAELADRLSTLESTTEKVILPLDWNSSGLKPPTTAHLDEWRRFAATLPDWQVLRVEATP